MASKSKTVATGVIRHTLSDGGFSYQADIERKGYPRLKETFPTLEQAVNWRAKEWAALAAKKAGTYVPPKGTVGELVTRYVKEYGSAKGGWSRSKQVNLDKLVDEVGNTTLGDVTKQWVIAYGRRLSTTRGPSGVQERMVYLGKVFRIARDSWDIEAPREAVRSGLAVLRELGLAGDSNKRDREIHSFEIAKIKHYLPTVMQDVVDALLIVPFRVSELCGIEWPHFDEINRSVQLFRKDTSQKKKTFKKAVWVTLPVIEVAVDDDTVIEVDTFDLLFNRGDRSQPGPFVVGRHLAMEEQGAEASRLFAAAHKLADIHGLHLHDTRSAAISDLFAQGFDVSAVSHLSGHTDWKTLQARYARLRPKKVHALFKRQAAINQQARRAA